MALYLIAIPTIYDLPKTLPHLRENCEYEEFYQTVAPNIG
jgi:hypothetical protein